MPSRTDAVCGLVLGAGGSRRLGQAKQLLPYGDGTLLGHVVGADWPPCFFTHSSAFAPVRLYTVTS